MKNVVNKLIVSQRGFLDFFLFNSGTEKRHSASGSLSSIPLNRSPSRAGYFRKSSLRPKKKGKNKNDADHAADESSFCD